ncbi:MAG: ketopantoate reductase family protein [Candidatus Baldrarchaeia archaeon]
MRVLIAGAGAIGSLFAAYLSNVVRVCMLGREWHIGEIRRRGSLIVLSPDGKVIREVKDVDLATSASEISGERYDFVMVTVKAYDTSSILRELEEGDVRGDCYVLMQNGMGNEEDALRVLGDVNLVRGITNHGAYIPEPGKVVHAGVGETVLGPVAGKHAKKKTLEFAEILKKASIDVQVDHNIQKLVWWKTVINAAINPLTAILKIRNGGVVVIEDVRFLAERIIDEAVEVARADGVDLGDVRSDVFRVAERTAKNMSSMLQDMMRGRRTEIDYINGAIVRKAERYGIDAPVNKAVWKLVKALEKRKELVELFI